MSWLVAAALARPCPGPVPFAPGEISLPDRSEYRVAFAPSGRELFFHVDPGSAPTIWTARREGERWTGATVAPFSGRWRDADPFVSPDGQALYFSSWRPVSGGEERADADLWVVRREGDGWGEPVHLGPVVNTGHDELYASVTAQGVLYWASDAEGGAGGWDIYRAAPVEGGFSAPENLGPAINGEGWEFNPWVSADERRLVFTGLRRADGLGIGDLYASERVDGQWQPARNLGPGVNSAGDDFHPMIGPRHRLVFVRQVWEPLTPSELWVVDTRCLAW